MIGGTSTYLSFQQTTYVVVPKDKRVLTHYCLTKKTTAEQGAILSECPSALLYTNYYKNLALCRDVLGDTCTHSGIRVANISKTNTYIVYIVYNI